MLAEPYGTYAPGVLTRLMLAASQNTLLGRGRARKLMAAGVRGLNRERLDARLFGQNVRLHMQGNSSEVKALMNPRKYSRDEFAYCREHMPRRGGVFVDIGANAGLFSLYVSTLMDTGTLIAAEPQPDLYKRLCTNLAAINPDIEQRLALHLRQTAVGGSQEGVLELSVPDQLGQASMHAQVGGQVLRVPVTPLAGLLDGVGAQRIDLLKIDVEGYEDQVIGPFLRSAGLTLWPRAIVMEHCHRDRWEEDCEALLIAHGYRLDGKDRTNLMLSWHED